MYQATEEATAEIKVGDRAGGSVSIDTGNAYLDAFVFLSLAAMVTVVVLFFIRSKYDDKQD